MDVGPWAEEKLDCLRKYLTAYTTILKDTRFRYFYLDAFAGPGSLEIRAGDDYFGTDEWFDLVYNTQTDMFGQRVTKAKGSADILVKWYKERLEEVFGYVSTAREIQSTKGRPLYYLIFAGPNKTGARIADYVLRQGARTVR